METEDIFSKIQELSSDMEEWLIALRRDFHRHPETGWLEMRTSAIVASELKKMGFQVLTGRAVCSDEDRMGVPDEKIRKDHLEQIFQDEKDRKLQITQDMKDGFTGVIGILDCGEGPCTAFRFDIDALPMQEETVREHIPWARGFSSVYPKMMHACGHDCHTAIGLGTAKVLSQIKDRLHGRIKLIFQPAEEGTRGAYSIVKAGHLDQVDYFAGGHVSAFYQDEDEELIPGSYGALATCKFSVEFTGLSAHAGRVPEEGKNAVMAAAHAAVALAGIQRHSGGMSRINVGSIHGGGACNVVPDHAVLNFEVRGETTEINDFMSKRAEEICKGAAMMEDCKCSIRLMGNAPSQTSDEKFCQRIYQMCRKELPQIRLSKLLQVKNRDSEDVGFMMNHVQEQGGQAVYMRLVTKMASPQHTTLFDVDEAVLKRGVMIYSSIAAELLLKERK